MPLTDEASSSSDAVSQEDPLNLSPLPTPALSSLQESVSLPVLLHVRFHPHDS
jgi:hypothetical protein